MARKAETHWESAEETADYLLAVITDRAASLNDLDEAIRNLKAVRRNLLALKKAKQPFQLFDLEPKSVAARS